MDTARLHDAVTRRVRRGGRPPVVVEVVHALGHPARMEPLLDLRQRYGTRIVEDAAEALGATWRDGPLRDRHVGTAGDLGCFSFNGNKVMTTGGGGMIVTDDPALAARARHLVTQAKLAGGGYVHDEVGYNYRLSNLAAAVGVAQLEQLPAFLAAKRRIAATYAAGLADLPVTLPPAAAWAAPTWWLYSVLVDPRVATPAQVIAVLAAQGIHSRPLWQPLHRQRPYRRAARLAGDVAGRIWRGGVSLPCSAGLDPADQDRVIGAVRGALAGRAGAGQGAPDRGQGMPASATGTHAHTNGDDHAVPRTG